jgi:hypothetical protein
LRAEVVAHHAVGLRGRLAHVGRLERRRRALQIDLEQVLADGGLAAGQRHAVVRRREELDETGIGYGLGEHRCGRSEEDESRYAGA